MVHNGNHNFDYKYEGHVEGETKFKLKDNIFIFINKQSINIVKDEGNNLLITIFTITGENFDLFDWWGAG